MLKKSLFSCGLKPLSALVLTAITLTSCGKTDSLNFSGVDPALTVSPTQVMVLGTTHLSNYSDTLSLGDLEPLLEQLEAYAPDVITVEDSSGQTCNRARTYPREHDGYMDVYCFDGAPYREESGLSISEGSFKARETLLSWPDVPTAAQRRSLAAAFIAGEEPYSALVQWHRLDSAERVAGDGLGPKSLEMLNIKSQSLNESNSIAARLAARAGLERVFYADDHGSYLYADDDRDAYGARLSELWAMEDKICKAQLDDPRSDVTEGDLLGAYRHINSKDYQSKRMGCDWKKTMNDAEPEAYGRRYTMGWQARNLRMVSLIMTAATTEPGGRVLSIVGASHKPYFEAYLDQMHDVEVVSTDTVLE